MATNTPKKSAQSDPRRYSEGTGTDAGNMAESDLYLNVETDEIQKNEPEKGQVLARKGEPVEPWVSDFIAARQG